VTDLCAIEKHIAGKGAALRVNNMRMDTSTPMLNVLGSIARSNERSCWRSSERGLSGQKLKAFTRAASRRARRHKDTVIALHKQGMGVAGILEQIRSMEDKDGNRYEIGPTSVYQIIADYRKQSEVVAA